MFSGLVLDPVHFIKTFYQSLPFVMMFTKNLELLILSNMLTEDTLSGRPTNGLCTGILLRLRKILINSSKELFPCTREVLLVSNISFIYLFFFVVGIILEKKQRF